MRKSVLLFVLFLLLAGGLQAIPVPFVKKPPVATELQTDTSAVALRRFNAKALKTYLDDKDFNYAEKKNHVPNWWKRFWNWVWACWNAFWDWVEWLLSKLFGRRASAKGAASVIKYILILVVAGALCYLVARLLGIDLLGIFRKKKSGVDVPYTESLENIHEINFVDDIEAALGVKNYRLAVRLLYLRCLKQLSDAGAINWRIEKTNSAYLNELTDTDLRQQFSTITRQFEYVWYGNFAVDGTSFQRINTLFQEFKSKMA